MSEYLLLIGKIENRSLEKVCIQHLAKQGLVEENIFRASTGENLNWTAVESNIDELCLMNLASIGLFLDHAARLEGFSDSTEALFKTQFKHLPWYMESIWLPIPFDAPAIPSDEERDYDMFIGSCWSLYDNLKKIREKSNLGLGETPQGYKFMRENYVEFSKSDFELNDDKSVIQWVWKGLWDGVTAAMKHNAPMMGI